MPWEALAWSLLELSGPSLVRLLDARAGAFDPWWRALAGWVHAVWIPFFALILGSISARDAGLTGFSAVSWTRDLLACGLALLAAVPAYRALRRRADPHAHPLAAIRAEPRWALYRAAAALWIPEFTLAVGAGMLLGLVDWILEHRVWNKPAIELAGWSQILRLGFSTLIFWSTRNLWLTAGMQTGVAILLRVLAAPGSRPVDDPASGRKDSRS